LNDVLKIFSIVVELQVCSANLYRVPWGLARRATKLFLWSYQVTRKKIFYCISTICITPLLWIMI
jgi:hypothetical protein